MLPALQSVWRCFGLSGGMRVFRLDEQGKEEDDMAHLELYMRPDGRSPFWQFDVTIKGRRRRISTGETDQRKARVAMARYHAEQIQDRPKEVTETLMGAVDLYVAGLAEAGKSWAGESSRLRHKVFGTGSFSDKGRFALSTKLQVDELTEALLAQLKAARTREGNGLQTIAHEFKVLRSAVIAARTRGIKVPTIRWAIPKAKAKTRWLSPEEWQAIYQEMDPQRPYMCKGGTPRTGGDHEWRVGAPSGHLVEEREQSRDLFVALTMCGGRFGEVSRLTTDQVMANGRVKLYGYKTQKERIVPCPSIMWEALERRRERSEALGTPYLFPAGNTAREDGPAWQRGSGAIRRAFERAGVNAPHLVARTGRATIHSLRHTFASWLLQNGRTLEEVQDMLGHESYEMTRRYAHLAVDKAVAAATEALSRVVARMAPDVARGGR